jgi:CRISPR/Cas system endoribonuclease Cas6 (RAMP superfamily)
VEQKWFENYLEMEDLCLALTSLIVMVPEQKKEKNWRDQKKLEKLVQNVEQNLKKDWKKFKKKKNEEKNEKLEKLRQKLLGNLFLSEKKKI